MKHKSLSKGLFIVDRMDTLTRLHAHPQSGTPPWVGAPRVGTLPVQRYTPGQVHPLGRYTPSQVHLPGQVHPPMVTAVDSMCPTGYC